MLEELPENQDNIFAFRVVGRLRSGDLNTLRRRLKAHEGKVRMLLEIDDLGVLSPAALLQNLWISMTGVRKIERFAVVGDSALLALWVRTGGFLAPLRSRYFEMGDRDVALKWLKIG